MTKEEEMLEKCVRGVALYIASQACERGNDGLILTVADRFAVYIMTGEIREPTQNLNN